MPLSEPSFADRPARRYVGIKATVTIPFGATLDRLFPEIFGWVGAQGLTPSGAPFVRYYDTSDMARGIEIEVGVPVDGAAAGDERVSVGEIPAGRYVVAVHTGPYDALMESTRAFLEWGKQNGVTWAQDGAGRWLGRVETYLTNPAEQPDQARWETELAFLTEPRG